MSGKGLPETLQGHLQQSLGKRCPCGGLKERDGLGTRKVIMQPCRKVFALKCVLVPMPYNLSDQGSRWPIPGKKFKSWHACAHSVTKKQMKILADPHIKGGLWKSLLKAGHTMLTFYQTVRCIHRISSNGSCMQTKAGFSSTVSLPWRFTVITILDWASTRLMILVHGRLSLTASTLSNHASFLFKCSLNFERCVCHLKFTAVFGCCPVDVLQHSWLCFVCCHSSILHASLVTEKTIKQILTQVNLTKKHMYVYELLKGVPALT